MADDVLTPADCSQLIQALDFWMHHASYNSSREWRHEQVAAIKPKLLRIVEPKVWKALPPTEPDFDFGEALKRMGDGKELSRRGWIGPVQSIHRHDRETGMFWASKEPDKRGCFWLPEHNDMVADDWFEVSACGARGSHE